jgi:hypothetical protein
MRTRLAVLLLLATACRLERREPTVDSTRADTSRTEQRALPPDSAVAWKFVPPPSWDARTRSVLVSDEDRVRLFQGARAAQRFDYLPQDTSVVPQILLLITVYDSAAWTKMNKPDEPPVGEVIARERGMVYIASLPQSNPFAEGSADFKEFEKRSVTVERVRSSFQVVSP